MALGHLSIPLELNVSCNPINILDYLLLQYLPSTVTAVMVHYSQAQQQFCTNGQIRTILQCCRVILQIIYLAICQTIQYHFTPSKSSLDSYCYVEL